MKQRQRALAILVLILLSPVRFSKAEAAAKRETVIHSFGRSAKDGTYPMAGLVFDAFGAAYGTASQGGSHGSGMVFKLTPSGKSWKETVLYDFQGASDGSTPYAGAVLDSAGALYGVTVGGGTGTCFYQNVSGCVGLPPGVRQTVKR